MLDRSSTNVVSRYAVALALCLFPLAFLGTGTSDVATQTRWLIAALKRGPVAGYDAVLDYPPGTTLVMWVATGLFGLPSEHAVKLVSSVFLVVGALLIGRVASGKAALATVIVFAYPTMILGYTDSLFLLPLVIAVFSRHWGGRFVALVALVALKWTALIMFPVFLATWIADVRTTKSFRIRRVLGDVLPAMVVVLAFVLAYGPRVLVNHLAVASSTTTAPSANAFNLHWLISWFWFGGAPYGSEVYDSVPSAYRLAFQILVTLLIAGVAVLAGLGGEKQRQWTRCLRVAVLVYFVFAAFSVHENHLFLAVALSIMVWGSGRESGAVAVVLSAAYLSNLFLYYGATGSQRPLYRLGDFGLLVGGFVVVLLMWVIIRDLLSGTTESSVLG